jgi:DNA processing protein
VNPRASAAAALLALPHMGPATLRALLGAWPDPVDAVTAVRSELAAEALRGTRRGADDLVHGWSTRVDPDGAAQVLTRRGTHVHVVGDADHPVDEGLPDHAPVLLAEGGRPDALDRPRVAVVGTRAATPHGLADAHELGAALARAGATVVSGLAIGIDAAAHQGALEAGGTVIGVLGTGIDVVYPRRHVDLHRRVHEHGRLVSEYWFGVGPHPSRFPVRNRIIAALADVVVVVEATEKGGARITADRALEYGRELCVYPGSRRNPSARGSNELLRSAHVVIDPDDVLGVLGLTPGDRRRPEGATPAATPEEGAVLRALGGEPATVDDLTSRTGLGPGPVAVAVAGLVRAGALRRAHGVLWPV